MGDDNTVENEKRLREARAFWDDAAVLFDDKPDHGLRDPAVRAGWMALLRAALPPAPAAVVDIGCGTGSISLVLAELGYKVTGIDVSPAMISLAETKAKASGQVISFHVMDAAFPQLEPQQYDVLVCRHVLWMLPHIDQVLQRWTGLLKPGGRLFLIEGYWTAVGLHARDIVAALPSSLTRVSVQDLKDRADLWGGKVGGERYAIIAEISPAP